MTNHDTSIIATGGASAVAIAFFKSTVLEMIPWLIIAIPLIALDLDYGIKAAKYRKESIRFSKGVRGTFGKMVEYFCWAVLASSLSIAFDCKWLEWVVLGLVYGNELASIIGNYLETKGLEISWSYVWNKLIKIGGEKVGVDTSDIDVSEAIKPKPKPARDSKGRFVKK